MIEFITEYWYLLIAIVAAVAVGGYLIYAFVKMPRSAQIDKVREWLLFAVAQAEKELGSGTGQLKLRYVYDMFIAKFPHLVKVVSFESFSSLVDEVLEKFRAMLSSNKALQSYVESTEVNKDA